MSYVKDMEKDLNLQDLSAYLSHISAVTVILSMPSAPIWKVSESSMKY